MKTPLEMINEIKRKRILAIKEELNQLKPLTQALTILGNSEQLLAVEEQKLVLTFELKHLLASLLWINHSAIKNRSQIFAIFDSIIQ